MLKKHFTKGLVEAGVDEAGRGCLAGPVVAAAVILPPNFKNTKLNDSKKLTEKMRNELRPVIEKKALAWAVGICSPDEIDEINILQASLLAMHKALDKLKTKFDHILVDGNKFNPYKKVPHHCIIKGDGKFLSIAAASVLAKTHRDEIMENLHLKHSVYGWNQNKGYPTKAHRAAIKQHGVTDHHRKSFRQLPEQLVIGFE